MIRSTRRHGRAPATTLTLLLTALLTILSVAAIAQTHDWSKRLTGPATEHSKDVWIDAAGNILVTGDFASSIDLGGGTLFSAGYEDVFLAKYDAAGNHLWSLRFGDTLPDYGWGVSADGAGNVYMTGRFYGTINFGGSTLVSTSLTDVFLAKFDSNGVHQWSKRFAGDSYDHALDIGVDASGNVVIVGNYRDTIDLGGGLLTAIGTQDVYVAKYDANGTYLWARTAGGSAVDESWGVAIDDAGAVIITGHFLQTIDFGGGPLTSAGWDEIFLVKYDAAGTHVWSKRIGGTDYDSGRGVTVDGSGDVVVTGRFRGTVNFGGGPLTALGGSDDIFLAKYEGTSGGHVWSRKFGSIYDDFGGSVATDACGNVVLAGAFWLSVDFGGGALTSAGDEDVFMAKYDGTSGGHVWSTRYGAAGQDRGQVVALDDTGNVVLTGFFQNTVDFGGGPLTASGTIDPFLARYLDAPSKVESVTAYIQKTSTLVPAEGNVLTGCPTGYDVMVIEVDLADGCFEGIVAQSRLTMSMPLNGNFVLYATHPTDWWADSDARPSNGYVVTFSRPFIGGCGTDDIEVYLDGIEIGQVTYEVRSFDMAGHDHIVDIIDLSVFAMHYPSCEGGAGNYSGCADFNDDGCVDIIDLSLLAMHWQHNLDYVAKAGAHDGDHLEEVVALLEQLTAKPQAERVGDLRLSQNSPNPFNPRTEIRFTLPGMTHVRLTIHDARGQQVRTLVDEVRGQGEHGVVWNGVDDGGRAVASGVYWYRLLAGQEARNRKMLLLR